MGTSSDFFDTLKGISEHMDLPQELKDMLPAFMDNTGTMISYGDLDSKSSQELKDMLNENINSIYEIIDSLSDEELFEPHMRKWADEATKTAVWEVYKFIHINTVAPFGTFRTKIRKWKKIAL